MNLNWPALSKNYSRIRFQEKLFFTKHLATMIKAGIPINDAFDTLSEQTKPGTFQDILNNINTKIAAGKSMADAISEYPLVFNEFYRSLIEVGEESGTLEESLDFLSVQLSREYALAQKIRGSMLYPGVIFLATTIMGTYIALFVLPQLIVFFEAFNFELPLTTKILLFVANLMKESGPLVVGGLVSFIALTYALTKHPLFRYRWHLLLLSLPLFGQMLQYGQLARFCRNLGVLIKAGLPINQSLEVTAETLELWPFKKHIKEVAQSLTKGESIHEILSEKKFTEFPPLISKMVSVGEKTGNLDTTLLYLGDFYEEEIDNISKNLSTILEPVLLLGIGLVVAFVAFAIISPIYQLTGSIR